MAALQERNGSFRILFRYHGKQHTFTLGEVPRDEAENKARQVDYLLTRLKQRLLLLPKGTDIVSLRSARRQPARHRPDAADGSASSDHARHAARPLPRHPRQRHHRGQQPRHLQAALGTLLPRTRRGLPAARTVPGPAPGVGQPPGKGEDQPHHHSQGNCDPAGIMELGRSNGFDQWQLPQ
jgi:hypothetical protein